ncbi:E3 ubiquitin-protein ligase UHRF1-like [Cloeon dipterum]|uniref:E3 ubiquitin-protein ligase UHRF1-like n=1 Tax=Cloeon dipterum TaxID=197152 RepID=UPI00321FDFFA
MKRNQRVPLLEAGGKGNSSGMATRSKKNAAASGGFFEVEDAVLWQDRTSGEWHEASIVGVTSDREGNPTFRVRNKRSGKVDNSVGLEFLAPGRSVELAAKDLEKGVCLLAFMPTTKNQRGWFKVVVSRVEKSANVVKMAFGTVCVSSREQIKDQRIFFVHNALKFPELVPREQWTKEGDWISLRKPCDRCFEDPSVKCRACCCVVCGEKSGEKALITCGDCINSCHVACADSASKNLDTDKKWLCTGCCFVEEEMQAMFGSKDGSKAKEEPKTPKTAVPPVSAAVVVPENHFGKIPGVPSGRLWASRKDVCFWGVHRSLEASMCGAINVGVQSLCLSDSLEGDYDNGHWLEVSGGRDSKTRPRRLAGLDLALAQSCYAGLNAKEGAVSVDWMKGLPIRLVRGHRFGQVSRFAPPEGYRYEGIFKVKRYFKEGAVWRFELRRDDNEPPPWSLSGVNFMISRSVGFLEGIIDERPLKRKLPVEGVTLKKKRVAYVLPPTVNALIKEDLANGSNWEDLRAHLQFGYPDFIAALVKKFACCVCKGVVKEPITLSCSHNACLLCYQKLVAEALDKLRCPRCTRCNAVVQEEDAGVNRHLDQILNALLPGYNPKEAAPKPFSLLLKSKQPKK